MNVYAEACLVVQSLLEGLVRLLPPIRWISFTAPPKNDKEPHGLQRFIERVDDADTKDFCDAIYRMVTSKQPIMVPDTGHWALKMPHGYVIFGEGNQGVSVGEKRRIIGKGQQMVENPIMTPEETAEWEKARKGL